jgi:uncharacterized protein YeeX (DUF496 family)
MNRINRDWLDSLSRYLKHNMVFLEDVKNIRKLMYEVYHDDSVWLRNLN